MTSEPGLPICAASVAGASSSEGVCVSAAASAADGLATAGLCSGAADCAALAPDVREPAQLLSLPLLYDDRGLVHGGRSYWQMWAQFAQIATPDEAHGHHFAHAMTALEAAVDEMGVVVSAPMLALPELQSGRLVAPFPVLTSCGVAYHAVSATRRASIELFVAWLVAESHSTTHALAALKRPSA
jgi:hypothetical protein